jgi:hypothetical protein
MNEDDSWLRQSRKRLSTQQTLTGLPLASRITPVRTRFHGGGRVQATRPATAPVRLSSSATSLDLPIPRSSCGFQAPRPPRQDHPRCVGEARYGNQYHQRKREFSMPRCLHCKMRWHMDLPRRAGLGAGIAAAAGAANLSLRHAPGHRREPE